MRSVGVGQKVVLDNRAPGRWYQIRCALIDREQVWRAIAIRIEIPGEVGDLLGLEIRVKGGKSAGGETPVFAEDDWDIGERVRASARRITVDLVHDIVVRQGSRRIKADVASPAIALN